MRVTFEIKHRVNNVFKHTRPGQRAVFGNVTNKYDGCACLFGKPRKLGCALAYLRHRTRRCRKCRAINGLNGIDHCHFGAVFLQRGGNRFQTNFSQQLYVV